MSALLNIARLEFKENIGGNGVDGRLQAFKATSGHNFMKPTWMSNVRPFQQANLESNENVGDSGGNGCL